MSRKSGQVETGKSGKAPWRPVVFERPVATSRLSGVSFTGMFEHRMEAAKKHR